MRKARGMTGRIGFIVFYALSAWSDALAQGGSSHALRGAVYDSIGHAPLRGAIVQVVRAEPNVEGRTYTMVTDTAGRFELAGLPTGRYAIGFQHPLLVSLGVESPLYALDANRDSLTANLATQSVATMRRQLCPGSRDAEQTGVLTGSVVSAGDNLPLDSAVVAVEWFELTVVKGKLVSAPVQRVVRSDERGAFRVCDLPADGSVRLSVSRPGLRALQGDVLLDDAELWHREIALPREDRVRGTGIVSGRVTRADGVAIAAGRVTVKSLQREVPIAEGAFTLTDLPAGTWVLDVSALGYEPEQVWVDVSERSSTPLALSMVREAQKLETINVVGKAGRDVKTLQAIHDRSLVAAGTMFLPGTYLLEGAMLPSDVIRGARGFQMKSPTVVVARSYFDITGPKSCSSRADDLRDTNKTKEVAIYLDGERWLGGLEALNDHILPRDLLAVEAYPDVTSAPFLWRSRDACAVIAFWTKR